MHYKDGTPAQVHDVVRGKGYNVKGPDGQLAEITGTVVGLSPGTESCNIQIARVVTLPLAGLPDYRFFKLQENVIMGCGPEGGNNVKLAARLDIEYGQCDHFELLHRPGPVEAPKARG